MEQSKDQDKDQNNNQDIQRNQLENNFLDNENTTSNLIVKTLLLQGEISKSLKIAQDNSKSSPLRYFKANSIEHKHYQNSNLKKIPDLYKESLKIYKTYLETYSSIKLANSKHAVNNNNDNKPKENGEDTAVLLDELIIRLAPQDNQGKNKNTAETNTSTQELIQKIKNSNLYKDEGIQGIVNFCEKHNSSQGEDQKNRISFNFDDITLPGKYTKTAKNIMYGVISCIVLAVGIAYFAGPLSYASVLATVKSAHQSLQVSMRSFFSVNNPIKFPSVSNEKCNKLLTSTAKAAIVIFLFKSLQLLSDYAIDKIGGSTALDIQKLNNTLISRLENLDKNDDIKNNIPR